MLRFNNRTGDLADAYHGLQRVGPAGRAEVVAAKADGEAFDFLNCVDVDQSTGMCTSQIAARRTCVGITR